MLMMPCCIAHKQSAFKLSGNDIVLVFYMSEFSEFSVGFYYYSILKLVCGNADVFSWIFVLVFRSYLVSVHTFSSVSLFLCFWFCWVLLPVCWLSWICLTVAYFPSSSVCKQSCLPLCSCQIRFLSVLCVVLPCISMGFLWIAKFRIFQQIKAFFPLPALMFWIWTLSNTSTFQFMQENNFLVGLFL